MSEEIDKSKLGIAQEIYESVTVTASEQPKRRFGIDQFSSEIQSSGVLQTNRFLVIISPPKVMRGGQFSGKQPGDMVDSLIMRCWQAVVPGVNMFTFDDVRRHGIGQIEKRPYLPTFNPLRLDFMVDRNSTVLKFFDDWCNAVINHNTDRGMSIASNQTKSNKPYLMKYPDEYISNVVRIWVYNEYNQQALGVKLYDAFPLFTSDIDLNWSSQNESMQFSVNLQFTHMSKQFPGSTTDDNVIKSSEEIVGGGQRGRKKPGSILGSTIDGFTEGEVYTNLELSPAVLRNLKNIIRI